MRAMNARTDADRAQGGDRIRRDRWRSRLTAAKRVAPRSV
jgi:hypothetical protein